MIARLSLAIPVLALLTVAALAQTPPPPGSVLTIPDAPKAPPPPNPSGVPPLPTIMPSTILTPGSGH